MDALHGSCLLIRLHRRLIAFSSPAWLPYLVQGACGVLPYTIIKVTALFNMKEGFKEQFPTDRNAREKIIIQRAGQSLGGSRADALISSELSLIEKESGFSDEEWQLLEDMDRQ